MDLSPRDMPAPANEQNGRQEHADVIACDFFCGVGGVTYGFLSAGIDVVCGIDNDPTVQATYEHNNKRPTGEAVRFFPKAVDDVTEGELTDCIGDRNGRALVFVGCAPCQPFTGMNTIRENQGDSQSLLLSFLEHIRTFLPDYVLVENVPGIESPKYGDVFRRFLDGLDETGYFFDRCVIDAKNYGIPQHRERMALIASRLSSISLPDETHGPGKATYVNAKIAFRYPPIGAGETHPEVANHQASALAPINLQRIRAIKKPGGSRSEWPPELQLECYKKLKRGYEDVYGRMAFDRPAPTLTTKLNSITNGRFGHPTEDRGISIREGATLQTFPDSFVFKESIGINARHIGNAVPVELATIFARTIREHYRRWRAANANAAASNHDDLAANPLIPSNGT